MCLAGGGIAVHNVVYRKTSIGKFPHHFIAHLEAGGTNRSSNSCLNVGHPCTELHHSGYGGSRNTRHGAAPPGMGNGDDAGSGIAKRNGDTVGSVNADSHIRHGRNEGIHAMEPKGACICA